MLTEKDNPPLQHPPEVPFAEFVGRWWVGHAKPRQEKALAWDLHRCDVSYFLPMYDKTVSSKGRRWKSRVVLFPGYIFFCGGEDQRIAALSTGRLVRMIEVPDQAQLVGELGGIARMLAADRLIGPVAGMKAGTPCRITAGPLEGMEGYVERQQGRHRFVLMVSMLGQGASVEVEADQVEPLE